MRAGGREGTRVSLGPLPPSLPHSLTHLLTYSLTSSLSLPLSLPSLPLPSPPLRSPPLPSAPSLPSPPLPSHPSSPLLSYSSSRAKPGNRLVTNIVTSPVNNFMSTILIRLDKIMISANVSHMFHTVVYNDTPDASKQVVISGTMYMTYSYVWIPCQHYFYNMFLLHPVSNGTNLLHNRSRMILFFRRDRAPETT